MHLQLAGQIEALQVTVGGGLFSWTEQKEPNFFLMISNSGAQSHFENRFALF